MKPHTVYFFSRCRNVVNVSNLIVALAAGTPIKVDRLPVDMLPAVVLLATIGLRTHNQQIIDDYAFLLTRMEEAFKDDTLANGDYDHPQLSLASSISQLGPRAEYTLDENPEADYMFSVYEELVNADLAVLFKGVPKEKKAA